MQVLTDSARWVVSKITEIITVKKHTKAEPYTFNVRGDNNTVVVVNAEGAELAIPPDAFELFKSKLIDSDLHKITTPLRPEQIESAEIRAGEEGDILEASISSEERGYFLPPESTVTSRETEIIGRLVSVNKETTGAPLGLEMERACGTVTQEITLTNSMWIFHIKEQFG